MSTEDVKALDEGMPGFLKGFALKRLDPGENALFRFAFLAGCNSARTRDQEEIGRLKDENEKLSQLFNEHTRQVSDFLQEWSVALGLPLDTPPRAFIPALRNLVELKELLKLCRPCVVAHKGALSDDDHAICHDWGVRHADAFLKRIDAALSEANPEEKEG